MPEVHWGVGRECLRASRHGDRRYGLRDGESGSRQRGGDSLRRRSASSSPRVLSSTTISGSPAPPLPDDRLDENDWRLILLLLVALWGNTFAEVELTVYGKSGCAVAFWKNNIEFFFIKK